MHNSLNEAASHGIWHGEVLHADVKIMHVSRNSVRLYEGLHAEGPDVHI